MTRKPPKRVDPQLITLRSHRRTLATVRAQHEEEVKRFQGIIASEQDCTRMANKALTAKVVELQQRVRFVGMRLLENVAAVRSVTDDENVDLLLGIAIDASKAGDEFTMRDGAMTPGPCGINQQQNQALAGMNKP